MNIKAENLVEVTNLKAGQRVIQVDGKWVVVGVGGKRPAAGGSTSSIEAGVLVDDGYGTLKFQKLNFDGTTPTDDGQPVDIEGTYLYNTGKDEPDYGGATGSAMDIVKVTEYSPYVPPYPEQIGYTVAITATNYNWETETTGPYDMSVYEGLYTVTEDTKHCSGFGRVFQNANGKLLYAWTYDTWEHATDESSYAHWCIGEDVNYGPDNGLPVCSNSCGNGTLPDKATGWSAPMGPHTIESCTLTPSVTAPATEAIPMVLNGCKVTGYDFSTGEPVDGTSVSRYSRFDHEPIKDWYYAGTDGKLFGSAVTSKVQPNLYVPFAENKSTAETGQNIASQQQRIVTIGGVPCIDVKESGEHYIDITPIDFLVQGKGGFSISAFLRVDKNESNFYVLCDMYSSKWNKAAGLQIAVTTDKRILVRGGFPKADTDWSYVSNTYIDNYVYPIKKWVHLTFVFHDGYEEYYANGINIGRRSIARTFTNVEQKMTIGNNIGGNLGFWDGYISQFKYYPNVISPGQVKAEADRCLAMVTE